MRMVSGCHCQFQVVLNRGDEVVHAVEHAPADGFVGQVPKPSFDQIVPRRGLAGEGLGQAGGNGVDRPSR